MGKNKAQRTKNNAKPSNSSRSAELLGTSIPNFVGFSAVKDGGYVPFLPGLSISAINEVEINTIDSNFQMVFKKMNKKDPITKFKALQEFADLCRDSPLPSVEAVLPFWPRLYCALAVDIEHRVREASQLAHSSLVSRVGRSIALYLKQLAGPWFTSQFDTYPPAASAATNSFLSTFPNTKQIDAIIHCQEEILSYIRNNLTHPSPHSLTTQKTLSPEETETKYQRILISSLQGYSHYIKKVPLPQITKTLSLHSQIISSPKFWKLGKHETLLIKTAFFNVLSSLISHAPDLLKDEKKRTMTIIMNSLDESEPGILSAVWECSLVAIDKTEDWWLFVSIEKLVLPKLWKVLRNGGQGCASVVYPSLLPFLSQFPKFNIENKAQLFINFFENMRQGFSVKTVLMSRSEILAITKSFIECLKYTIMLNTEDSELCKTLLKEQLIPVVESCIKEFSQIKSIVFTEVTGLIRYWSKNRSNNEYKNYSELIKIFWEEVELMFQRVRTCAIDSHDKSVIENVHMAEIKLLMSLKKPEITVRRHNHVRFADSEEDIDENVERVSRISQTIENDEIFLKELGEFVNKLCISYIKNSEEGSKNNIIHLNQLVTIFQSKELLISLAKAQRNDGDLLDFYHENLKPWIETNSEVTDAVIQLIFILLKYMTDEEKEIVLNSLVKLDDKNLLNSAVMCGLNKENRTDSLIKKWLETSRVTEHLINISKEIIAQENSENIEEGLILLAFEPNSGEFSVNEEAINGISEVLCSISMKSEDKSFENVIELISKLLELSWDHKKLTSGALKLLKTLFELSLNGDLSREIKESIQQKWKIGFSRISHKLDEDNSIPEVINIQKDCLKMIYDRLYESGHTNIDQLVNISVDFIEPCNHYEFHQAINSLIEFNIRQETMFDDWIPQVTDLVLQGEIISGNFYLENPLKSIGLEKNVTLVLPEGEKTPDRTQSCLLWALFNSKLLNKLLIKIDEDEVDDSNLDGCLKKLPDILNSIILITSLGKLYQNHYKYSRNYETIVEIHRQLEGECRELRKEMPRDVWSRILGSIDVGTFWTEFGSIFSEFLKCFSGNDEYLGDVTTRGAEFLDDYLERIHPEGECKNEENVNKTLSHHLNALIISRNLLQDGKHPSRSLEVLRNTKYPQLKRIYLLNDGGNSSDISKIPLSDFYLCMEFIRLYTKVIKTIPEQLDNGLWDMAMVYLSSWLTSVSKSRENHQDIKVRCFVAAVSDFFSELQAFFNKHKVERIPGVPETLLEEWRDIFVEDVHRNVVETWMFYGDLLNSKNDHLTPVIVLNHLGRALRVLHADVIFGEDKSARMKADQLIRLCIKLLSSPVTSLQSSAFHLLKVLIPKLIEEDKVRIEEDNFGSKGLNLVEFEESLLENQKIVNAMLMDFRLCDTVSCVIQTHTDSYTYTLAYLLEWMILLEMCEGAHADLRYQYAEVLKDEMFPSLMNNVFRLMPVEVLQENKSKGAVGKIMTMFRREPVVEIGGSLSEIRVEEIVCWIYIKCLRHLPVLARQWWSTTESRVSSAVERITTLYVSPILCQEELFNKRLNDVGNLQIKVQPNARAVVALYEMDDTKLELSMVLPVNHPLGLVTVEPGQHAGGASNWRNCHMQLSIFLTHQNGSIWDGLMMWKRNLDKKFAGVEECYICFSIFHINTYQIPKLSCHTCRKKFHAPCLYKWFSTSQKATCPICRNVF